MGDWSDYFEDFPEENPANWVNGRFDPALRAKLNSEERLQAAANSELLEMIRKAKKETKAKSQLITENCPQYGLEKLRLTCYLTARTDPDGRRRVELLRL